MDITQIIELWNTLGWFGKTVAVLLALHPVASAIVALTPTPKDDKWPGLIFEKIIKPLALAVKNADPKGPK
jgi:hypothetical protein